MKPTTEQWGHLSPAAQAVLNAFLDAPVELGSWYTTRQLQIAAALRALTQELKYVGITEKNILAIANELEGPNG